MKKKKHTHEWVINVRWEVKQKMIINDNMNILLYFPIIWIKIISMALYDIKNINNLIDYFK
jgi:hypothetical protein